MEQLVLKQEIVDKITGDGALFGKIADALGIAPVSLPRLLYKKDKKLTQAGVLKVIKNYLGVESESELLDVVPDTDHNDNKPNPIMQASH